MTRSRVYIHQTAPDSLPRDTWQTLAEADFSVWDLTAPTYIKINGNYDRPYPGSNTSPWFLDALLGILRERGFECLTVIEGDLPYFTADQMIRRTGLIQVLERHAVPFVNYEHLERDGQELPRILDGAQVINVSVVHGHGIAVMSCATKNLFGLLPKTRRKYHQGLSQIILDLADWVRPFTIVDGTVGLIGPSTRRGDPVRLDLVVAGWNPVAVDVVVARMMGYAVDEVPHLRLAAECGRLPEIELVGEFDWDTLPSFAFPLDICAPRHIAARLESTWLESWGLFRWGECLLERMYHHVTYLRKRKQLFSGPWMEYERVWRAQLSRKMQQ